MEGPDVVRVLCVSEGSPTREPADSSVCRAQRGLGEGGGQGSLTASGPCGGVTLRVGVEGVSSSESLSSLSTMEEGRGGSEAKLGELSSK